MSRLESFRRRLNAQIDGINWAIENIGGTGGENTGAIQGDILEMGLGNGRTYDHLREYANRRIWVIDRVLQCHPSCVPPNADFLKGEADDMLVQMAQRGTQIAFTHYEFGIGVSDVDSAEATRLAPLIKAVMAPQGLVVSQQKMPGMTQIDGPPTVDPDRYFFYRNA
ncbi:class I SAM-dependent methyltransferase [Ascidiaceihabitans sp.]|uniref:class I SAM-dependent methyltransferase n=1 Tax=Ascidiaceihabitans sp. TaxID=1872644 RepID=UPI0032986A3B